MSGPAVTVGCSVVLTPGASGPPDAGVIIAVPQASVLAGGLPLAVTGSICQMVNSVTGAPYPLSVGSPGSSGFLVGGAMLLRIGDAIPTPPGVLMILGPPASPIVLDVSPP
jgi:uncharacterized Zn-binding protein involved in type VI secretion